MTNKEKALALIGTFVSGDTEKAKELLAKDYIQHNLAYGTGADAFVAAIEYLASAPVKTTVNNIRAFEDGDYKQYIILQARESRWHLIFLDLMRRERLQSTGIIWLQRQNLIHQDIHR